MWYIVLTRPRQEQRAADNLARQGGHVYLPLLWVERVRNGKRTRLQEPLFPGYVFLNLPEDSPLLGKIRSTLGVRGLLRFGQAVATLDERIIQDIRCRTAREQPEPSFVKGDSVQLKSGPFKDYQAIFHSYDGEERAVILLHLLGQQNQLLVSLQQLHTA